MNKTSLPKPITIKKIIQENFRTKTFVTDEKIIAQPGQFVMLWLPRIAEKPFSVVDDHPLTFTAMSVGPFTKNLNSKIEEGDKIWYRGPFGKGTFKTVKAKKLLVAGGCGAAPLLFLAQKIKDKKTTRVIIGAKTQKELLFEKRFKKLGTKIIITTDDGSKGIKGFATNTLEKILKKEKISGVYSCGPKPMLKKVAEICDKFKTRYQLSLEALIKCGFGVCGSCSCGGKLVCQDGPVFSKWLA